MLQLHILNSKKENFKQSIHFFSEDLWKKSVRQFPKGTSKFFSGKKGESFVIVEDIGISFLIGLGNNFKDFEIQKSANDFAQKYSKNIQPTETLLKAPEFKIKQVEEAIKGLFLGTYHYPFVKDHPFWHEDFHLYLENINTTEIKVLTSKTQALCKGQFTCMDWLNKPANHKKTEQISSLLKSIAEEYQLKYSAFNREEAGKKGLGAFVAVNQGSAMDAAFSILEYIPKGKIKKSIGLVGKCVLFDTGGISLKDPNNMHYMKSDMGGATAVIGALMYAAEMKLPYQITAILPVTDNAISEKAYTPSDVVTAYNGKTIEVLNTDAEGRMTLADGLAYMVKNYNPDYLLDLATLTGSAVRMFGDTCGALFSTDHQLKDLLLEAGDQTNQRLWNLPLWEVWEKDIQSDVANLKNISMKPVGDCIVAATFLKNFIENHPRWAHMDIAAMTFGNVNYAKEKAATGYGVQLLINFLEKEL